MSGPKKTFNDQDYHVTLHGFWIGAILPVPFYFLAKRFPHSWVRDIHIPVILGVAGYLPPALTGTFMNYLIVGFVFNYYLKRYKPTWWERYAFAFSAGMDAGTVISSVIIFFALQFKPVPLEWVGNEPLCINAGMSTIEPTEAPPPS